MSDAKAQAVKELAVLGQKLADGAGKLFGPAADQIGSWTGEIVETRRTLWRLRNHLRFQDKVDAILRARGITEGYRTIPPRLGAPLLDAVGTEDDEMLLNLWAGLIANAADPNRKFNIKRAFIQLLRSLDPRDTDILRCMLPLIGRLNKSGDGENTPIEDVAKGVGATEQEVEAALFHLTSLGCFRVSSNARVLVDDESPPDPWPGIKAKDVTFSVTSFAIELLEACAT